MSLELLAFGIHVFGITWVRTTITNSGKDQKTDGDDCNSKEYVSVHCSLCEIVVQLIVPSELNRFKRGDTQHLSNHGAFNILETTLEIIKNVQKFMTSLSILKQRDCSLKSHWKNVSKDKERGGLISLQESTELRQIQCHPELAEVRYH